MTRVLVTGASGGIGSALCDAAIRRGCTVIATARRIGDITARADTRIELDVTSEDSVGRAVEEAGPIDVVINNAGVGVGGAIETVPIAAAQRTFDVNFFGAARVIRALLPQMRARRNGTIVNLSSMSAELPWPFGAYYAASKAALSAISDALRHEVEPFGIRVVVVEPGIVSTRFGDRFETVDGPADYDDVAARWSPRFTRTQVSAEVVSQEILAAVLDSNRSTRIYIGDDARTLLPLRRPEDDSSFLAEMKRYFGVTNQFAHRSAHGD